MNRRERIIKVLNHEETDVVPYYAYFTMQKHEDLSMHLNDKKFYDKLGIHMSTSYYSGQPKEVSDKPGYFIDDFGVVWNRSGADKDIGVIVNPLIEDLENYSYEFPELDEESLRKGYENLIANKEDKFVMAEIGFSMFERSWSLMGMENTLMSMIICPEELEELYDRICDYNIKILDIALEYDIDGVFFGDDWGQQKGLIMGPNHWRRFIKPRMKRMYDRAKEKGKYVFQHSCGDIHEILTDLIEIGLDCYQTFQPEIYNIEEIKDQYGDKLTFWGGISTQQLLPFATPEEVKKETKRIMNIMSKNGGYIAGPTHCVPGDVPNENVIAMMEVFMNQ